MQKERHYIVQVVLVKEYEVDEIDELQAERAAYRQIASRERDNAVAMHVMEIGKDFTSGALASDDPRVNWKFAKEHFSAVDPGWVSA